MACAYFALLATRAFCGPITAHISLNASNFTLREIFGAIERQSNLRILVAPSIRMRRSTLHLRNVSTTKAIELICKLNRLRTRALESRKGILLVLPMQEPAQASESGLQLFAVQHLDATCLAAKLEQEFAGPFRKSHTRLTIEVDERTNALVAAASYPDLRLLEAKLAVLDTPDSTTCAPY